MNSYSLITEYTAAAQADRFDRVARQGIRRSRSERRAGTRRPGMLAALAALRPARAAQ